MSNVAKKKPSPPGKQTNSGISGTSLPFSDIQNSILTDSGISNSERTSVANLGDGQTNRIPGRIIPILQVSAGAEPGRIISLAQFKSIIIGRGKQCELIVYDPTCSRQHAEVFLSDESKVMIKDLGSSNGTKVNGQPITTVALELKDGDRIHLGENTILRHVMLPEDDAKIQMNVYYRATRDGLTNAFNRHQFEEALDREIAYQKRAHHGLGVIYFDVDHFKKVNDTLGHSAGDEVLREIGLRVPTCIRAEDIFARIGGEEFAVLVRAENQEGLRILAERIRIAMEKKAAAFEGKTIWFTVSVGAAFVKGETEFTAKSLLSMADEGLYEAKRAGRNQLVTKVAG